LFVKNIYLLRINYWRSGHSGTTVNIHYLEGINGLYAVNYLKGDHISLYDMYFNLNHGLNA